MILKRYALACFVLGYMAAILILHFLGLFPRPGIYDVSRLIGASQVAIEGKVLDAPVIRWDQTRFLLQGHAVTQSAFKGRVLVTLAFPDEELAPGDSIRVRGWLSATRPPSASREFDEQGYWATRRVFSMLKVWSPEGMTVIHRSPRWGLERSAWIFHKRYRTFWESVLPFDEAASLLLGITLGARADIACVSERSLYSCRGLSHRRRVRPEHGPHCGVGCELTFNHEHSEAACLVGLRASRDFLYVRCRRRSPRRARRDKCSHRTSRIRART